MDNSTVLVHLVFLTSLAWGLSTAFNTLILSLYPRAATVVFAGLVSTAAIMGGYLPADPVSVVGGSIAVLAGALMLRRLAGGGEEGEGIDGYGEESGEDEQPRVTITGDGGTVVSPPMGHRDNGGLGGGMG